MAKRTPKSEADDTAAAAPSARPARGRRTDPDATAASGAEPAPEASDTLAARSEDADPAPADAPLPTEEHIRVRAYLRYLERGGGDGMDFDDWLEAERELKSKK